MFRLGAFNGGSGADKDGNCTIGLASVLPWQKEPGMFSGKMYPGKETYIEMNFAKAQKIKLGDIFLAVCNPFECFSDSKTRHLMFPLVKVGKNAYGEVNKIDNNDYSL